MWALVVALVALAAGPLCTAQDLDTVTTEVLSLMGTAQAEVTKGNRAQAATLFEQAAHRANKSQPADARLAELGSLAALQANNIRQLNFDSTGVGGNTTLVTGKDFADLNSVVQQNIRVVQDYDKQMACLGELQLMNQVLLVDQASIEELDAQRHVQELSTTITSNEGTLRGLSNELSTLQGQYQLRYQSLRDHIAGAVTAEGDQIQRLNAEIKQIRDSQRRKSIIGGIFAGLQVLVGAVATALGAPEVGIPLIIGGITKGIDTAQDALNSLSPIEAREEEVQWCLQAISDLQNLQRDAEHMGETWQLVTSGYDNATYANQLPGIYLLTITADSFESYISSFELSLVHTAGQAGVDVSVDAAVLRQVISLTTTAMQQYYQTRMSVQHAVMQQRIFEKQAQMLQEAMEQGLQDIRLLNRTQQVLRQKRTTAVSAVVNAIAMQRKQFSYYTLDKVQAQSMVQLYDGDTVALQQASASNLEVAMRYQQRQYTSPRTCWTQFHVAETKHAVDLEAFRRTGTLSVLLSPPTAPSHAFNAFVGQVRVYFHGLPKANRRLKVRITKGAGDMRVDAEGNTVYFLSPPVLVHSVYHMASGCELSSRGSTAHDAELTKIVEDGRQPSLFGLWSFEPSLTAAEREKVSRVEIGFHVGFQPRAGGGQDRLFEGGDRDSDGVCGEVFGECPFYPDSLGSASCSLANADDDKPPSYGIAVAGFAVVLVLLVVLNLWVVHRMRSFGSERERAHAGNNNHRPNAGEQASDAAQLLQHADQLEGRMATARRAREVIRRQHRRGSGEGEGEGA